MNNSTAEVLIPAIGIASPERMNRYRLRIFFYPISINRVAERLAPMLQVQSSHAATVAQPGERATVHRRLFHHSSVNLCTAAAEDISLAVAETRWCLKQNCFCEETNQLTPTCMRDFIIQNQNHLATTSITPKFELSRAQNLDSGRLMKLKIWRVGDARRFHQ